MDVGVHEAGPIRQPHLCGQLPGRRHRPAREVQAGGVQGRMHAHQVQRVQTDVALQVSQAEATQGAEFVHLERLHLWAARLEAAHVVEAGRFVNRHPLVPHPPVDVRPVGWGGGHRGSVRARTTGAASPM